MQPQLSGEPLSRWIRERIEASGPVTLAQFIEWALYHPEWGYYTTGPSIGPRGDFTTSPEASPAFGRLLATHVVEIDSLLGSPTPLDVIEFGPGKGTLAKDLLVTLETEHGALLDRLRYWLVEISPALAESQRTALLPRFAGIVRWAGSIDELPQDLQGAVIANEFVDAFPVHVLENRGGETVEQYVENTGGATGFRIVPGQPSRPELLEFLAEQAIELQPGQRVEINLAAGQWVRETAGKLLSGVVTVIDYGHSGPGRYSDTRKEGTLLSYFGGRVTDNVLARPGTQDITALVDFTALETEAVAAGLQVLGMTRQAQFLIGLGLGTTETVGPAGESLERALSYRRGLQALFSPEGLGKFHVLLLGKGLDAHRLASQLSGLKYADI